MYKGVLMMHGSVGSDLQQTSKGATMSDFFGEDPSKRKEYPI